MKKIAFILLLGIFFYPPVFAATGDVCTFSGSDIYVQPAAVSVNVVPAEISFSGAYESGSLLVGNVWPYPVYVSRNYSEINDWLFYSVYLPLFALSLFATLAYVFVIKHNDYRNTPKT